MPAAELEWSEILKVVEVLIGPQATHRTGRSSPGNRSAGTAVVRNRMPGGVGGRRG